MRTIRSVLAADRDVVGDDQEAEAAPDVELAHERDDLLRVLGVEVAGRLVGPDDRRVVDERAGDRDPLALPARQLVRDVVGPVGQPDELERVERAASGAARALPRDEQRKLDVLDRAQHRHQVVELEDEPHVSRAVVGALAVGHLRQGRPLDQDLALVDGVEPGEAVEQRRLAAAARAHDRHHLAACKRQVDTTEGRDLHHPGVVGLHDRARVDDRARAHGSSSRGIRCPKRPPHRPGRHRRGPRSAVW